MVEHDYIIKFTEENSDVIKSMIGTHIRQFLLMELIYNKQIKFFFDVKRFRL